jgi:hypothetical protein
VQEGCGDADAATVIAVAATRVREVGAMQQAQRNPALITCPVCGQVLGMLCAGYVAIKHEGREIVAERIRAIRCERCAAIWEPPIDKQAQ